ncbi:MAG: DUF6164 family protein [Methylococcales bacterium]|nr:DUF6164 family protein [Methylococcales bacterium]
MSILFFPLRGVPADEADDIRELLTANEIAFYETSAGILGISMPAIWLYDQQDADRIRPLFDAYQRQRQITQHARYLELKKQGQTGLWQYILKKPLLFLLYVGIIALTLYVSVKWVFELGL